MKVTAILKSLGNNKRANPKYVTNTLLSVGFAVIDIGIPVSAVAVINVSVEDTAHVMWMLSRHSDVEGILIEREGEWTVLNDEILVPK